MFRRASLGEAAVVAWAALLAGGALSCALPGRVGAVDSLEAQRNRMVEEQIEARGVSDPRVLAAMREVPRHLFVPEDQRGRAYEDGPLAIGHRQTISQPYIVAVMSEQLRAGPGDTVLEVGTGSGYQAAVLSRMVARVYSIEIVPELAERASRTLASLGYDNVEVITGDGFGGLPERAPFDGILVTAAPEAVPPPLVEQLGVGARLVIPVGGFRQELRVLSRSAGGVTSEELFPVRFVPLTRNPDQPGTLPE